MFSVLYILPDAVEAAVSRFHGHLDDPLLERLGALTIDPLEDVRRIFLQTPTTVEYLTKSTAWCQWQNKVGHLRRGRLTIDQQILHDYYLDDLSDVWRRLTVGEEYALQSTDCSLAYEKGFDPSMYLTPEAINHSSRDAYQAIITDYLTED